MTDATQILHKAAETMAERAKERDVEKERAMAKTVAMVNAMYPDLRMTETQGWAFMIFLKLARSSQGQYRADDFIDLASYSALMGECEAKSSIDPFKLVGVRFSDGSRTNQAAYAEITP